MLSGPSFGSVVLSSINSLTLFGFPLTSFHSAEASLLDLCRIVPFGPQTMPMVSLKDGFTV